MHSNSILSSSLLDIIFDNRNKNYGAYLLRKNYNKRLLTSLVAMLVLVTTFIIFQMHAAREVIKKASPLIVIADPQILSIKPLPKTEVARQFHSSAKSSKSSSGIPVIVKNYKADTNQVINISDPHSAVGENQPSPFEENDTEGTNAKEGETIIPAKSATVAVDKTIPVPAEILPEYPGGIKELMKFLKRNLNSPEELQDGNEIAVKVRFIVSYNGDLTGFSVIETGGEPFDKEVIRVLKKMPKWIPGKTNGENVSAYFIVPVKFRISD